MSSEPFDFLVRRAGFAITVFCVLAGLSGVGCGTAGSTVGTTDPTIDEPDDGPILLDGRGDEPAYAEVRVYYATDRNDTGSEEHNDRFGPRRGDVITYGSTVVSIPRDHRLGELERPSVLRFQFRENPERHVVLLDIDTYDSAEFFERVSAKAAASDSSEAFVFVHGYNVSFAAAARRTAQMTYDLGFSGAPVFYSWPSRGALSGYSADETTIAWAPPHIAQFLRDIARRTEAQTIHLIAHSMGNRGMTAALTQLVDEGATDVLSKFKEVILTAPDIDADIFKRDILPKITSGRRVTLYASAKDRALLASKELHAFPRAGDAGDALIVYDGLDTIDATQVATGFLGHSYFAENASVVSDIFYLVRQRKPAVERESLVRVDDQRGAHFRIKH